MNIIKKIDLLLQEDNNLFDNENEAKKVLKDIENGLNAPYVDIKMSTISKQISIFISISLDKKEDWPNKIYQNSRYSQFSLQNDTFKSNLEQISKDYKIIKKFRKCKVKNIKDVITKINKYIKDIS